jgi:DtxR family Mn-dependent transcriptional regulator
MRSPFGNKDTNDLKRHPFFIWLTKLLVYGRCSYFCLMQHFVHQSEENYLKALFKLENRQLKKVNNIALAKSMDLNPATVLEMVRKMSERGLVTISADKAIQLSDKGRKKALQIVRRHRIWEVFLVDKLGYKWNEVHDLAEQLEHVESEDLVKRLDKFLGSPQVDPHGDPIPDELGRIKKVKTQPLVLAPAKTRLTIRSLANTSDDFLRYLDKLGLSIGSKIEIVDVENFDGSLTLLHEKKRFVVSKEVAENLLTEI